MMSPKYPACGDDTGDCTCEGDYREGYHACSREWNKAIIDRRFTHLNARIRPLSDTAIDPPKEKIETKWINIHGREEHEKIIKDADKCKELGLDQKFEVLVYLMRWGGWLRENQD